ncbi:MAG: methyltransferase domain-containing protein [bacterium]
MQQWLIRRFLRRVTELAATAGPGRILDAGCGEGFVLRHLAPRLTARHRFAGVDASTAALGEARARDTDAALLRGDIHRLPFGGGSFELVIATEVLEHLEEPERALEELRRVSRRFVLLSVPREPFFAGLNLMRGKNLRRLGSDEGHRQHWTRDGFLRFVRRRLTVVAAPQGAFPWTLVLTEVW